MPHANYGVGDTMPYVLCLRNTLLDFFCWRRKNPLKLAEGIQLGASLMKGQTVVLRVFGGHAVLAKIVDDLGQIVVVMSPEQYDLMQLGSQSLFPLGFTRGDVFQYEEHLPPLSDIDWQRMQPL